MSLSHSPQSAATGLVLNLDAGNTRSLGNVNRNLLSFSENLDNAYWLKSNCSVLANSAIAPDGTLTADKIIANNVNTQHLMYTSINVVGGTTYVWSCYAKASEYNIIQFNRIDIGGVSASFNLAAGTVSGASSGTASIVLVGNGWYRCIFVYTPPTTLSMPIAFQPIDLTGAAAFVGNNTSGVLAWGLQFEIGSSVSTYYPVSTELSTQWTDLTGNNYNAKLDGNVLTTIDVLVVAGGGGGGADVGGGGGAGGVVHRTNYSVTPGRNYSVIVGAAGLGQLSFGINPTNGSNSTFDTITAIGGGHGGSYGAFTGASGGSGGGSAGSFSLATISSGTGVPGQGNEGGLGTITSAPYASGGGGGAGGPGFPGDPSRGGGNGGPGVANSISGTVTFYGGGGGGGGGTDTGSDGRGFGGIGGGGTGAARSGAYNVNASFKDGIANTGGGGGGTGGWNNAGNGGAGIVIVRYPGKIQRATGGTVTVVGDFTIHTFTTVGSFTFATNTSLGVPSYSPAGSGSLYFNGTSHYLPIPTAGLPYRANPSTMEAWVRSNTASGGYQFAISYGNNISNQGRHIGILNNTFIHGSFGFNDITGGTVVPGVWYHLVGTYNGTVHRLYVNGVQLAVSGAVSFNTTEFSAQIGCQVNGATQYWNGDIASAKIYNRALTDTEILQNFNALRGRHGL
jgi:hypothetical protein